MMKEMKFKKINLQNLEPLQQPYCAVPQHIDLLSNVSFYNSWADEYPHLCYKDTSISQKRVQKPFELLKSSFFFDAFWYAYMNHGDIVLVPDEIWIMIGFYLSAYIDKNAEKLRKKLVKHEGIKTLVVMEIFGSKKDAEEAEKSWDYFFDQIINVIEQQTVKGVVQIFACNFSTTTKIYKTISTAIIMNSLKSYFKYQRCLAGCGINNVHMAGTRQDWTKILMKLEKLNQFDVDGKLKKYIQYMSVIVEKFVDTFDGKPDVAWWNTVMMSPEKKQIYGGQLTEIDGWILHFFGYYQKRTFQGFPEYTIKVPIKLTNFLTKTQKQLVLVSDWSSVSKLNEQAYKPDVGLVIFQLKKGPLKNNQTAKNQVRLSDYTYNKKIKLNNDYLKANNHVVFLPQIQPKSEKKRQKSKNPTIQKLVKKQKQRSINDRDHFLF